MSESAVPRTETKAVHAPHDSEVAVPHDIERFELLFLALHDCSVERGGGNPFKPGRYDVERRIESNVDDDGDFGYLISNDFRFLDDQEQSVALVRCTFNAYYTAAGQAPTDSELETFGASAILQTTPFIREFVASMTNRLAMPTFFLPVLRGSDIAIRPVDDESLNE